MNNLSPDQLNYKDNTLSSEEIKLLKSLAEGSGFSNDIKFKIENENSSFRLNLDLEVGSYLLRSKNEGSKDYIYSLYKSIIKLGGVADILSKEDLENRWIDNVGFYDPTKLSENEIYIIRALHKYKVLNEQFCDKLVDVESDLRKSIDKEVENYINRSKNEKSVRWIHDLYTGLIVLAERNFEQKQYPKVVDSPKINNSPIVEQKQVNKLQSGREKTETEQLDTQKTKTISVDEDKSQQQTKVEISGDSTDPVGARILVNKTAEEMAAGMAQTVLAETGGNFLPQESLNVENNDINKDPEENVNKYEIILQEQLSNLVITDNSIASFSSLYDTYKSYIGETKNVDESIVTQIKEVFTVFLSEFIDVKSIRDEDKLNKISTWAELFFPGGAVLNEIAVQRKSLLIGKINTDISTLKSKINGLETVIKDWKYDDDEIFSSYMETILRYNEKMTEITNLAKSVNLTIDTNLKKQLGELTDYSSLLFNYHVTDKGLNYNRYISEKVIDKIKSDLFGVHVRNLSEKQSDKIASILGIDLNDLREFNGLPLKKENSFWSKIGNLFSS